MADRVKEAQRAELHKTIWRIANDLRGSVDGWDFKSYVLGVLFYRFISENLEAYLNKLEREAGNPEFDYAELSDNDAEFGRKDTVNEKGFYILPGELFANVRKRAAHDENLNETLGRVFKNIEGSALGSDSEDDLKGLFDDLDVNSAKLGNTVAKRNEKLVKLLDAIGDLDLGNGDFTDNTIDAFGDAYEYLMTMYASSAGKSGGEFFTPQEVSELLARITVVGKTAVNKVYDPACGSGSLLLKYAKVLGKDNVRRGFFGQEINLTTYNLARINMFLHDVNYEKFDIAHGDTLTDPAHWDDEPFEAIVSNPPYSIKWDGDANPLLINDPRYAPAGILAPKSKADLAFTMHILSWLAVNGTAAIVEFPGVLYRGGTEQKIRKYLIENNYVDAVIQLPPDLFFGTSIATCIIVLKKSKKDNAVLFINASNECDRQGNKNKLREGNRSNILKAFVNRANVDHFATIVSNDELAQNNYNIAVSSYVEAEDAREIVDITALNAEIAQIVARQAELRAQVDAIVGDLEAGGNALV
jgi:type I restriction enzyme M protein